MAEYRSEFLQVWVVGGEVTTDELASALGDLEHAARSTDVPDHVATEGGLPLALRQFFAGLGFLRDHLWSGVETGAPGLAGLLLHGDRLWALRAGVPAVLDQLTGAPTPIVWHEPSPASGLAWCEIDATEVWRLETSGPEGALSVHHRPALASVLGTLRDEALADSSTPVPAAESAPSDAPGSPASAAPTPRPAGLHRAAPRVAARPARTWRPGRRTLLVGAGLLVVAVAALLVWAREPLSRAVVGRYDLSLATHPGGASVRIDGELVPGRTPLTVPLEPGEHRVELTYGDYANAIFTVDGERGEAVRRDVAWTGSLGLASADTSAKLRVAFDGQPWGALPLWRDDVPVGRHRLSFQGDGVRPWEEEVKIKSRQSTRVTVEPVRVPDYGLVTARAERVSRDGVEDVEGAAVSVDGRPAGVTPLDLRLSPGPHSLRIASGAEAGAVHLIDVQAGGRFFASTTFGRPAEPAVSFDVPARISLAAPPTLVARLVADVPLPVRRMRLYVARGASAPFDGHDFALENVDGRAKGVLRFPTTALAAGQAVRAYVEIETREGEEFFSEVRAVPVTP